MGFILRFAVYGDFLTLQYQTVIFQHSLSDRFQIILHYIVLVCRAGFSE